MRSRISEDSNPCPPEHRAYESIVPVKRIQQVGFSGLTLMARLGGG